MLRRTLKTGLHLWRTLVEGGGDVRRAPPGREGPRVPAPAPAATAALETGGRVVLLDVGCRWGFAERFAEHPEDFFVVGFEPDGDECSRLTEKYAGRPVLLVPQALAGAAGRRRLYVTREPACSSLLEPLPELTEHYPALRCAQTVATREVETTTLDDWARRVGLRHADYLKLDTQGTELEILQGGARLLETVRVVDVELEFNPIYRGQSLFADVDRYLRSAGFVLWRLSHPVHYSRSPEENEAAGTDALYFDDRFRCDYPRYGGQLFWADACYVSRKVLAEEDPARRARDERLLETLELRDVLRERPRPPRR